MITPISSRIFSLHYTGNEHTESFSRFSLLPERIFRADRLEDYTKHESLLNLVHDEKYIDEIKRVCKALDEGEIKQLSALDDYTALCKNSYKVACFAAGYAVEAAKNALDGLPTFAFVRPPGHHAGKGRASGFCLFNNIAIATSWLVDMKKRNVLIIDFDLHRGDGTQDIFQGDDEVFYASVNQINAFPDYEQYTGDEYENVLNRFLPSSSRYASMKKFIDTDLNHILEDFEPDIIAVSAGFDGCYLDKRITANANLSYDENDFMTMKDFLENSGKPFFLVLEGGYNPQSIKLGYDVFCA